MTTKTIHDTNVRLLEEQIGVILRAKATRKRSADSVDDEDFSKRCGYLKENYPTLFQTIIDQKDVSDPVFRRVLTTMLNAVKRVQSGSLSEQIATEIIGQKLFNEYVPAHLHNPPNNEPNASNNSH